MTVESFWPQTVGGWIGLATGMLSLVGVGVGWGKGVSRFDQFGQDLIDIKKKVEPLDPNLRDRVDEIEEGLRDWIKRQTIVEHTLWGPRGTNGMVLLLQNMGTSLNLINDRLKGIEARNKLIDALEERSRSAEERGEEDRHFTRRKEDRILRGEEEP